VHSQDGTTFVSVVRWEDVGVELGRGGRHVEVCLTKKKTSAGKLSVIGEIAGWDWIMPESEMRCDANSRGLRPRGLRSYGVLRGNMSAGGTKRL
jgi:hypothetical protein